MAIKEMIVLLLILAGTISVFSQAVSVNATGLAPNASAGLDVDFANLGLLIPRVALTGTASPVPLAAHVAGMVVYNTAVTADVTTAFYYDDGTKWIPCESDGYMTGDMQYWNGTTWALIPAGKPGQQLQLSTANIPLWVGAGFASLITSSVSSVTPTTAACGGNIVTDGGFPVTTRGVCWSTVPNPTTALTTKTIDGAGTGTFVSALTGLTTGTSYYIRSYATNSSGTIYGNQFRFVTP